MYSLLRRYSFAELLLHHLRFLLVRPGIRYYCFRHSHLCFLWGSHRCGYPQYSYHHPCRPQVEQGFSGILHYDYLLCSFHLRCKYSPGHPHQKEGTQQFHHACFLSVLPGQLSCSHPALQTNEPVLHRQWPAGCRLLWLIRNCATGRFHPGYIRLFLRYKSSFRLCRLHQHKVRKPLQDL